MASEGLLKERLQDLERQIGKKQSFKEAVSSIKSLLIENYSSASPSLRKLIYSVVCRVATVLQTRYTSPEFWFAGKGLFEEAERLVTESSEREHLKSCVRRAHEHLHEKKNQPEKSEQLIRTNKGSRYLFEGHLTVDPEPPKPLWSELQQNTMGLLGFDRLLDSLAEASLQDIGGAAGPQCPPPASKEVVMKLPTITVTEDFLAREGKMSCTICREELVINDEMQELPCKDLFHPICLKAWLDIGGAAEPQCPPPASKEVVMKLPTITVTEEICKMPCTICQEELVINDEMQELPCRDLFHRICLKAWLDKHNNCPICLYELPTDDHAYEGRKQLQREAEEERRALRGGELMYV